MTSQPISWFRVFFDIFGFEMKSSRWRIFVARLIIPCSANYRQRRAANDNGREWSIPPWPDE